MYPVILAQWMKDKRNPLTIIAFIVLSILATVVFSDGSKYIQSTVAIFSTEENAREIEEKWEKLLNEESDIEFVITDEEKARKDVSEGRANVAVRLLENDYRLIVASEMPEIEMVDQALQKVFTNEARLNAIGDGEQGEALRKEVINFLNNPPLKVQTESIFGGEITSYNMGLQLLFAFTLFCAMFTIGFKVNGINVDKVSGIWNRMILSPISKTNMYLGHLLYSFFVGFFQMVIVLLIFKYLLGYELGNYWMILVIIAVFTLSMVSVAILFTGFANTPEKFYMLYPSIIPIIPIISGAYMLPGTISNPVLLFIADLFPLAHAIDALMGVALYDSGWSDIALPLSFMLLIGVICMGVGINLVERLR